MNVSINPLYFCNFRCPWCYLTEEQLSSKEYLDITKLDFLLEQINNVNHIDLYGGEVGLLSEKYVDDMLRVIDRHYNKNINVTTNLSCVPDWFYFSNIDIAVSFDFETREKHDIVLRNMMLFTKPLHVIVLANQYILNKNVDEMISILNTINNVVSVEVKPYSTNQSNRHNVSHKQYEQFVKRWIESPITKRFNFQNEEKLVASITKQYNAFSDDHVYITPSGKFAVLEFDKNDNEFFLEFDELDFYKEWCHKERNSVTTNTYCSSCEYMGRCLTEHYRSVNSIDNGCSGYYGLIKWYENGRMET